LIKYGDEMSLVSLSDNKETLLHLTCRSVWSKLLQIRDEMNQELAREDCANVCKELEERRRAKEKMLLQHATPVLATLLEAFKDYSNSLS
jgi:hypothetical protein